ncbi:MAG: archaetidylserine decarboxylase [Woeseiaceae bacterium]|nr:archaetidylserine decarboxylase [Woeseiaceae bacterium]
MPEITAKLFVALQCLLPRYLMTALVYRITRIRQVTIKNFLIRQFIRLYHVDTEQLLHPVPDGYKTFNDFFIRALADGSRPVSENSDDIVSPVDGTVSAAGALDGEHLIQAKGHHYSLPDLLASDTVDAERFVGGAFATIYLAPYNYHRVHAPVAGKLTAIRYIPGALYSVNDATVRQLPQLFARNERVACHLDTEFGPMILLFVGALNVGTINTIWTGDIRPRKMGVVEAFNLNALQVKYDFARGDTLGWFNMGSTVILITPPGSGDAFAMLGAGQTLRMGETIGRFTDGT